jgi:hypothetical protein
MEEFLIVLALLIALDLASLRWGFDSTDKIDSPEWERRSIWRASDNDATMSTIRAHHIRSNGHIPVRMTRKSVSSERS